MAKTLDLAFTIDCTASMHSYIVMAKNNIEKICKSIEKEGFNVRFALVEYRDHPPQLQGFITRPTNFMTDKNAIKQALDKCALIKDGIPADLCFMFDASGSIGADNFRVETNFAINICNSLPIGPENMRIASVTYSSAIRTDFNLSKHNNKNDVINSLKNIQYMNGGTDTAGGLRHMINVFKQDSNDLVQKLGIVITDGCSNDTNSTIATAQEAKNKNIQIFAIGVGNGINQRELNSIASAPSLVTTVQNMQALDSIKGRIVKDTVENIGQGADEPEALEDGLFDTLNLTWNSEIKICVVIADQPPHGLGANGIFDNHPNGCPNGYDPIKLANQLAVKGISLYVIGCEPDATPYRDFFMALAIITGGLYIPLTNAEELSKVIVGAAMEEISLRKLTKTVKNKIHEYYQENNNSIDESIISNQLIENELKNETTIQLKRLGNKPLVKMSGRAKRFARFQNMQKIKEYWNRAQGRQAITYTDPIEIITNVPIEPSQVQRLVQKIVRVENLMDSN